eukprot:scaffold605_cov164-Skeletonema_menzelii.AAC.1
MTCLQKPIVLQVRGDIWIGLIRILPEGPDTQPIEIPQVVASDDPYVEHAPEGTRICGVAIPPHEFVQNCVRCPRSGVHGGFLSPFVKMISLARNNLLFVDKNSTPTRPTTYFHYQRYGSLLLENLSFRFVEDFKMSLGDRWRRV